MAQANATIFSLEGLVGSGLRGGANASSRQRVTTWLECMKSIMRSQGLRDATDWAIVATDDAVNAAASLDASGGTVYGVLIDSIYDVANEDLFVIVTNVTGTLDATIVDLGAAPFGPDAGQAIIRLPDAADTATPEFGTWLDPSGQVHPAGVFTCADGQEGTAPTALDVRVYVIYRDSVEARV